MTEQGRPGGVKLENRMTAVDFNGERKANYADLIKILIDGRIPAEGLTMDVMRKNFNILDKLEENHSAEVIDFTPGEIDIIKFSVEHSIWRIQHKDLVVFADYITTL